MQNSIRSLARRAGLASAAAALATGAILVAPAAEAAQNTVAGQNIGACTRSAAAGDTAYRTQMVTRIGEWGRIPENRGRTAYMTMNVEWCTNGSVITYGPVLTSNAAAPTQLGLDNRLSRVGYTKSYSPGVQASSAGMTTEARWNRPTTTSTFPARSFTTTMKVLVRSDGRATCTNSAIAATTGYGTPGAYVETCVRN